MEALQHRQLDCPYCGERIDLLLDGSAGEQRYIEDCRVCCRPIEVRVTVDAHGQCGASAARDDDA